MLDIGTIFLGAYLVSYAIAVVMPTWRWLLALTIVVAVVSYTGWLQVGIAWPPRPPAARRFGGVSWAGLNGPRQEAASLNR
jgi:hypothetical protein